MICQKGNGYSVVVTKYGVRLNGRLYPFPPGITNTSNVIVIDGHVFVGNWEFYNGKWTKIDSNAVGVILNESSNFVTKIVNEAMNNMKETFKKIGW